MAATSNRTRNVTPDLDAASDRVREANDRIADAGRKVTVTYLDGVERWWTGVAKAERKFADQAQVEAVGHLLSAHASLTEDVVKASVAASRELIGV
jgi:ABC-type branched-subunit amino acid transport system substrate-binding protein